MNNTNRLYWYEGMLKAIDFFTQRFTIEQISEFAFEFSNEILTLNASALFIKEGKEYVLKKSRVFPFKEYTIKDSEELRRFPSFVGNIVRSQFESILPSDVIKSFKIKLMIPLMIDDEMQGFIISDGKVIEEFHDDDYVIASSLMRLINNSLENSKYFTALQEANAQVVLKNYNLFTVNQNMKALLSEVTLERVYKIATEVFSEVTGSQVTSFGVYDAIIGKIKITGYRNINNYLKYYTELELKTTRYDGGPIVLHIERDAQKIQSLFYNWDEFGRLNAKYIVLIVKEEILGLVTLGDRVNGEDYDPTLFELIESLSSSTYIAISNAMMFNEIQTQKQTIEKKYKMLTNLNKLVRNINHCATKKELYHLTLKTMHLNFGIQKAFICFRGEEEYKVSDSIGIEIQDFQFRLNEEWKDSFSGETLYDFSAEAAAKYFNHEKFLEFGQANCAVISPIIFPERSNLSFLEEEDQPPSGYLVVLETIGSLKEEEILLIDTITKNIAPIIYQMCTNLQLKQDYIKDERKKFLKDLEDKIDS